MERLALLLSTYKEPLEGRLRKQFKLSAHTLGTTTQQLYVVNAC
jgi:hypothetical protein